MRIAVLKNQNVKNSIIIRIIIMILEWMTKTKTTLFQKDLRKGTIQSNYRPITYLHMMWNIQTACVVYSSTASQRHNDKDARRKTHEERKQEGRRRKTSLQLYLPLTLLQGFERLFKGLHVRGMLETEDKLHILNPLLWPSRCVVLVLLMLGSTPSGLSEDPLGRVWSSLPHLVSTV